MTDAVETMAYAASGGVPWHGLGEPVGNDLSVEEMLERAGLDWTVSKRELYFRKVVEDNRIAMRIAPQLYGLVRDSDESFLDSVGENFKPVQNRDAVEFFTNFVKAGDMTMETMGSLRGGRFIWALARINEGFKLANGDETRGYLLLSSPHQFGFSLTAALTPVRVVCWNTLTAALGSHLDGSRMTGNTHFRMVHSSHFNDTMKERAAEALGLAHAGMVTFRDKARMLSETAADHEQVMDYFHQVLRLEQDEVDEDAEEEAKVNRTVLRFQDNLLSAPGQDLDTAKGTWWGALNSVTYTVDHQLGLTQDNRLHSAWYGRGAGIKRRALELAVNFADPPKEAVAA